MHRLFPALLGALVLAACSDASTISAPPRPTTPSLAKGPKDLPNRGPIIFTAALTGQFDVYSAKEDGTGLKRLTFSPSWDDFATVSPDGSKILFISDRVGKAQYFVMNSDGTGVKQITSLTGDYALAGAGAWSPDGKKIAFGMVVKNGLDYKADIYLMSASGTGLTRVTNAEGTMSADPVFSPDGKQIAFSSDREVDNGIDVWVMNVDGTNATNFSNCEPGYECSRPAWSPDGGKVAVNRKDIVGGTVQVAVIGPNGSFYFATPVGHHDPFWSPDGVKLGMIHDDGIANVFVTMDANGTSYTPGLRLEATSMRGASWSR
jgi:Tol biopolymer transport system component